MQPFVRRLSVLCFAGLAWSLAGQFAAAQDEDDTLLLKKLTKISKPGPFQANIRGVANLNVPKGYRFVPQENIKKFNEVLQELTGEGECGAIYPEKFGPGEFWYILFSYSDIGYVKDEDKDKLEANELLKTLREGQVEANKELKKLGQPARTLRGWEKAPFYDNETHNLTWAIQVGVDGQPGYGVNYNSRILGRGGVMEANLVTGPDKLAEQVPIYNQILTQNYKYIEGQKYSDWKSGDKVAEVGLIALIAGGAGIAAAKTGLLSALLKGGKVIIVAIGAAIAGIVGFFKKLFGRGNPSTTE